MSLRFAKHRTTIGIVFCWRAQLELWLFKVIDMCTPWSLETRPRSKILAKTLQAIRHQSQAIRHQSQAIRHQSQAIRHRHFVPTKT
jgi:hypothetical protein